MKSRLLSCLAVAAITFAVPGSAAHAQGTPATKGIKAGIYKVDGAHTQAVAKVMHLGFNSYYLLWGEAEGSLTLDPAKPAASKVSITIPMESLKTSNEELTAHLKKPDFFDAPKFPTLSFTSTAVKPTGATTADITGNLTVHGVTKPVTIKATFVGQGIGPMNKAPTVGFEGATTIRRSDFGVSYGVPMVGDEVKLKITAAFEMK